MPLIKGGCPVIRTQHWEPRAPSRGTNPRPHPTLRWEQLPQFFQELEQNDANGSLVTLCAVKVLFMTFLRVGSLVPMRWEELDYQQDLWTIPAARMKSGRDHVVPLTDPLKEVIETLRRVNGGGEYAFTSPRSRGCYAIIRIDQKSHSFHDQ